MSGEISRDLFESLQLENSKLSTNLQAVQADRDRLDQMLAESERKFKDSQENFKVKFTKALEKMKEMKTEIENKTQQVANLSQQLSNVQSGNTVPSTQTGADDVSTLKEELIKSQSTISALTEENRCCMETIDSLRNKLTSVQIYANIPSSEDNVYRCKQEILDFIGRLDTNEYSVSLKRYNLILNID